ncbi:MAG: 6-phosphogluconolactonase [Methylovulum sp.]|jgi:6-phosphogluconolactonase
MHQTIHWHPLSTAEQVADVACEHILNAARTAIAQHGHFKLVLAGGSTPEKVYRLLAQQTADWQHWIVYYGDERCLAAEHPERNSALALHTLLTKVAIPAAQIFTIPAELGNDAAAAAYRPLIAAAVPFDMVLLGIGEDGHTASLFPGHIHQADEWVHAVNDSPKPPAERVSMSANALSQTNEVIFLITGSTKRDIVTKWRNGEALPVGTICPAQGVTVYIDHDALPSPE